MRRRIVVGFALLASLLLIASMPASAAHVDGVSINTTDTDFNAGELNETSVSGTGEAASVVLDTSPGVETTEDFEEGSPLTVWPTFSISNEQVTSTNPINGSFSGQNSIGAGFGFALIYDTTESQFQSPNEVAITARVNATNSVSDSDWRVLVRSGSNAWAVIVFDDGDNQIKVGGQTGTVVDSWSAGESYDVEITDIDLGANTFNLTINGTSYGQFSGEFSTSSVDQIALSQSSNAPKPRTFTYDDIRWDDATAGTYIGANHTAENGTTAFTNLTVTNGSAQITWQNWTGSGWNDFQTDTYTTDGNKTISISSAASSTKWRVRALFVNDTSNGVPTIELHDEGVLFGTNRTFVDNASATPTGVLSATDQTLQIIINDSDFALEQGDTVTVEFFVDSTSQGTDTLTANGTASLAHTFTGGDHTWSVTATDDYGHSQPSQSFSVTVPEDLTIRNETSPYGIVDGCTANARFFETTDDNPVIVERTDGDGDGNISLSGLPVGTDFIVSVRCTGYHNRTVFIDDIFQQSSVFLLSKDRDAVEVRFEIDDRTGEFGAQQGGVFIVQKAINRSEYNSSADGFEWTNIGGDELGATNSFIIDLEREDRYRLKIINDQGDERVLKSYTPKNSVTETVVVGRVQWVATSGNATLFNASIENDSQLGNPPPVIQIQFVNPANLTENPDAAISNFNYSVFEAGNTSNQIDSGSASGDLGSFYAETNISEAQANQKWVVQVQYTVDDVTVLESRVVGGSATDIPADQDWLGLFALIAITSLGLLYGQRTVNVGIVMMWVAAGAAMVFELIVINEAWYIASGFIVAAALIRGELR